MVELQTLILIGRRHFAGFLAEQPLAAKIVNFIYWPSAIITRLMIHPWALLDASIRLWGSPAEMCLVSGIIFLLVLLNIHFVTKEYKKGMQSITGRTD